MYLRKYTPGPALRPWVRSIQVFELETGAVPMFVPAWARFSLIFQYGDLFTFQRQDGTIAPTALAGVTGPLTEPLVMSGARSLSIKMMGVDLRPLAAFEIAGDAVSELKDGATALADILHRPETEPVTQGLAAAGNDREKLAIVEGYLWRLFQRARYKTHPLIAAALHLIHESGGRMRPGDLSHALGVTDRHLRREFGRSLGIPPKKYAQCVRIEGVINRLYAGRTGALARLAQDFDYHDEAHMINDVKRHTLLSPGEMIASGALDWLKLYMM